MNNDISILCSWWELSPGHPLYSKSLYRHHLRQVAMHLIHKMHNLPWGQLTILTGFCVPTLSLFLLLLLLLLLLLFFFFSPLPYRLSQEVMLLTFVVGILGLMSARTCKLPWWRLFTVFNQALQVNSRMILWRGPTLQLSSINHPAIQRCVSSDTDTVIK